MINNKLLRISCFLLVSLFSGWILTDNAIQDSKRLHELDLCSIENNSFIDEEHLVYRLYYNWKFVWIPAGEVVFKVKESEDYYDISATGKTYKSYDSFFKVRDYFYSRVDKETMLPVAFKRDIEEGKYRLFDSISFDQSQRTAMAIHGKSKETATETPFEFDNCMQDMLSILYYIRNVDYNQVPKGSHIPINVFFDKEVFPLTLEYGGKDKKKKIKNLGKYNTLKFIPEVVAGEVFDENTKMKIWVSDDQNKIPLLIESPVSVGSVKAVLKSSKGLKYELSSEVK